LAQSPRLRLRVGVVGLGTMGARHANVLARLPGVDFVGGFARQDRLTDIVPLIDAAVVAVPTSAHHSVAATLIRCGVHVLVEKPLAPSIAEAEELGALADKRGLVLMVGHIERFNPAAQAIAGAVDCNSIVAITLTRVGPKPKKTKDVGVLLDSSIHDIDLVRWLTRSEIIQHQAMLAGPHGGREDIAFLQMRTASGVIASLRNDWLSPAKERTLVVKNRDRLFVGDLLLHTAVQHNIGGEPSRLATSGADPLESELRAFVSTVRGEAPNPIPALEGMRSLASAISCLEGGVLARPLVGSDSKVIT
jgi:UDP-N-acetylglucosamine 3-dehydrogenase